MKKFEQLDLPMFQKDKSVPVGDSSTERAIDKKDAVGNDDEETQPCYICGSANPPTICDRCRKLYQK